MKVNFNKDCSWNEAEDKKFIDKSKHIQNSTHEKHAWCGENISEGDFFFKDVEHAVINGHTGGEIIPCWACLGKIISCLLSSYLAEE